MLRAGLGAAPADRPAAPGTGGRTFAALSVPAYRWLFAGMLVSNVGTWMGRVAQDWLVLVDLTDHSSVALGLVTGLQFLPWLLLAPFSGLVVDRYPKRRILAVTQGVMLLSGMVQAVLVLSGAVRLWQVFSLAAVQGVASAVDAPARQTLVSEIVPSGQVSNAVGLSSASFNAARLVGPGVAGVLIAALGTGWVFAINALSFAAVLLALTRIGPLPQGAGPPIRGPGQIREGVRYLGSRPDLVVLLGLVFVFGTFGLNFQLTTALMATTVFGKGPTEYGLLGSILAIGSVSAALLAARRSQPQMRTVMIALALFSVSSALAALSPSYLVFAVLLVPVGLSALTVLPTANAIIQLSVPAAMRGRVMALYLAVMMGGTPIGAPLVGWVGQLWGARWSILVGSIATALALLAAFWSGRANPDIDVKRCQP